MRPQAQNNGKAKVTAGFIVAYDGEALCSRSFTWERGEDEGGSCETGQ